MSRVFRILSAPWRDGVKDAAMFVHIYDIKNQAWSSLDLPPPIPFDDVYIGEGAGNYLCFFGLKASCFHLVDVSSTTPTYRCVQMPKSKYEVGSVAIRYHDDHTHSAVVVCSDSRVAIYNIERGSWKNFGNFLIPRRLTRRALPQHIIPSLGVGLTHRSFTPEQCPVRLVGDKIFAVLQCSFCPSICEFNLSTQRWNLLITDDQFWGFTTGFTDECMFLLDSATKHCSIIPEPERGEYMYKMRLELLREPVGLGDKVFEFIKYPHKEGIKLPEKLVSREHYEAGYPKQLLVRRNGGREEIFVCGFDGAFFLYDVQSNEFTPLPPCPDIDISDHYEPDIRFPDAKICPCTKLMLLN